MFHVFLPTMVFIFVFAAVRLNENTHKNENAKRNTPNDPKQRDNALDGAFGVYNHLTHSEHLVRNTASILYLLRIVDEALPSSRVKGNISVTLWKQACQFGVITPELSQAIQNIHQDNACGPEFDIFIKQVATPIDELPQRYRRFANKTKHLKNY